LSCEHSGLILVPRVDAFLFERYRLILLVSNSDSRLLDCAGLLRKFVLILGAVVGGLVYKAITPPPVKVLNSPGGPQVTAPRIETRDGRHIAYKEVGERESAKHNIIHIHGVGGSRHLIFPVSKVGVLLWCCCYLW
jgi:hypothetical protein